MLNCTSVCDQVWLLPLSGPLSSLPPPTPMTVSPPLQNPWGINIIKKNKKAAPRAFGVGWRVPASHGGQGGSCHTPEIPEGSRVTGAQRVRAARDLGTSSHLILWTQLGEKRARRGEHRAGSGSLIQPGAPPRSWRALV